MFSTWFSFLSPGSWPWRLSRICLAVPRPTQSSEDNLRSRKPRRMISCLLVFLLLGAPVANVQGGPIKDVVAVEKGDPALDKGFWVPDEYFDECEAFAMAYPVCQETKEGLLKSLIQSEATEESLRRKTRTWKTIALVSVAISGGLIIGLTARRILK